MKLLYAILLTAIALPASAHGPTPRKTDESALIKAPVDVVWKKISEPCAIATWHPEVADCKEISKTKRTLTLKNGGKFTEEFDEVLPAENSISYRLGSGSEIKALPVSSLTGKLKVKAEAGGSRVTWALRYYRADTENEPKEGQDDESAQKAVDSYVKAGLSGLGNPAKSNRDRSFLLA